MSPIRNLLPLVLLTPLAASADWFSGNAGVASDYLFRGLDQTNSPAAQGGLDYARNDGLYAGGWASNNRSAGSGGELDLYGGASKPLTLLGELEANLDLGAIGYLYSGERKPSLGGGNQDFAELYAGLGAGPASFKIYVSPDYANRNAPGFYFQGALKYPLGDGFTLRGTLGWSLGGGVDRQVSYLTDDGRGQPYLDYAARLDKSFRWGLTAWVEIAGTDLRLADGAQGGSSQPKFVAGLCKDFDF
jgi:uncharacterized protein (TIGR02001 family)